MGKQFGTTGPRAINPSIAQDIPLGACSLLAQLLFTRLIAIADDQGRQPGLVALVRANCMPLVDEANAQAVEAALAELANAGVIVRYEGAGQPLIQLRQWWRYQAGQRHIYPSKWPAPDAGWDDRVKGDGEKADPQPAGDPQASRRQTAADSPASAVPVPKPMPVPVPVPASANDPAPGYHYADAYKAHQHITGRLPSEGGGKIIEDLARRCGREALIAAMYSEPDHAHIGFLGRVKKRLVRASA